jgi:hypothetical protein
MEIFRQCWSNMAQDELGEQIGENDGERSILNSKRSSIDDTDRE